jgi:hypothetical protein
MHELVHVDQLRRRGDNEDRFACDYGKGYLEAGNYRNNPLEEEAYDFVDSHSVPLPCVYDPARGIWVKPRVKGDMIVRNDAGDLLLYPFRNGTFKGHGGGAKVGNGFHFTHYFVGNWTGDGTDDLIVRNDAGDLLLYPFRNKTFKGHGGGAEVGHGFDFTHYFVGNWTGDGTDDLIVRNNTGQLFLYPFKNGTFKGHGGGAEVGHGFDFSLYMVGAWVK